MSKDLAHGPVEADGGYIKVWPWVQKLEFDSDGEIAGKFVCEIRVDGETYETVTMNGGYDGAIVYCTDFGYSNGEVYRDDGHKRYSYDGPLTEEMKTAMRQDIAQAVEKSLNCDYDEGYFQANKLGTPLLLLNKVRTEMPISLAAASRFQVVASNLSSLIDNMRMREDGNGCWTDEIEKLESACAELDEVLAGETQLDQEAHDRIGKAPSILRDVVSDLEELQAECDDQPQP